MKMALMLFVSALGLASGNLWAATGLQDSVDRPRLSSEVIHGSRHASAGTDWKMNTEVLTCSRARGLFAGITLNGAVLQPDDDSTLAIYGRDESFRSILSGDIQAPKSTLDFMKAIADAGHAGTVAEVSAEQK